MFTWSRAARGKDVRESLRQAALGCSERYVQVEGRHVRFWHAGSGPAVVLIHGLLGYSFSWRHVIPILARSHEVFAPDMPGSGFSECDPRMDCRISFAADRLLQLLDAMNIFTCDLAGSSYGGATVLMLAAAQPSRIRRLILISPANPWSRYGARRLALLQIPPVKALFPILARPLRPLHNYFLRRLYGNPHLITSEVYRGYLAPLRCGGRIDHALRIVQSWDSGMEDLRAALPRVSHIPTLLVWGSRDRAVDPVSAGPLSRNFRDVQVAIIKGAGHLPYEECPEQFSVILGEFLDSRLARAEK